MPIATLNNPSPATGDRLGGSVALDGTRVVAGAPFVDIPRADRGAAYVFGIRPRLRIVPAAPGSATLQLPSPENMLNRSAQVAFAFQSGVSLELMLDGKSLIRSSTSLQLSDINDVNNWVGESQWSKDHCYRGTFDELRIYNVALTACQLQTLYDRGPALP